MTSSTKVAPKIEDLDRLAVAYATAIRAFVPLALQADAYYGQGDYKDDKWAKGRGLDEKLAPLIAQLEDLSAGIHKGVTREIAGIRERELAALEAKEGKGANWHALNYMLAARDTLDAFRDGSPEMVAAALERLQKDYDDGQAYAAAHRDEAVPNGPGGPRDWFKVGLSARLFLSEVKDMNRKLRPEAKSSPAELDREFDLVVQRYNQLVHDYNNG